MDEAENELNRLEEDDVDDDVDVDDVRPVADSGVLPVVVVAAQLFICLSFLL